MKTFLGLLLIASTSLAPMPVCAQTTPPQDQDDVVRVRSNEVRLDVVVKDKKGRPIKDLKPGEFEVLEDGVPQKVESSRFVSREAGPAKSAAKKTSPRPPAAIRRSRLHRRGRRRL